MNLQESDWVWLDAERHVAQAELVQICSLTSAELDELVEYGALLPLVDDAPEGRQFSASCVPPLREAARLRAHYDLDLFTVSLLLGYLQQIAHLEHQLRVMQTHLPPVPGLPELLKPWNAPRA